MFKRFSSFLPLALILLLAACSSTNGGSPTASPIPTTTGAAALPQTGATLDPQVDFATNTPLPESGEEAPADSPTPPPTDAQAGLPCTGELTPPDQEGPYYTPGSPERTSLIEPDMSGEPILLTGQVFDADCNPIPGAQVDFWQTDAGGAYDNAGYRLRGHTLTGPDGGYAMETILPGEYPGRPPHIHVKVFAPDGRELLTSQLYFPEADGQPPAGVPASLIPELGEPDEQGRREARFDFVVRN